MSKQNEEAVKLLDEVDQWEQSIVIKHCPNLETFMHNVKAYLQKELGDVEGNKGAACKAEDTEG